MNKLYNLITFHNNTTPALNETNLNAMSQALDDIDDRVIELGADVLEKVPQIIEIFEDVEELSENPPYIGANGNWFVWDTNTGAYVDSGVDASITITIADVTALAPDADPYVTNTGTNTDPIFHLFIPKGEKGDAPTTKYTQTLSAGSTSVTFTNVTTTANSIVAVATNVSGLEYNTLTNSGTSYTATFDAQASDVEVYLLVTEVA